MRITITSRERLRSPSMETFESLAALEDELSFSASDEYRHSVLGKIRNGETHFVIRSGPDASDTYDIEGLA